jgi:hypothetical protein
MLVKLKGSPEQRIQMRNVLFSDCDWMTWRQRDQIDAGEPTSLTEEQWSELLAYRAALRAWPVSGDYSESFPAKPGWMV